MLVTENGNYFFDVELVFKHNRTRLKLERNSNIATRNDMLKLLQNRRRSQHSQISVGAYPPVDFIEQRSS